MSKRLAVAVVHYHLRPGGVTRVIERAVEALGDRIDVLVLTGEAPAPGDALAPISESFQALAYSDAKYSGVEKQIEDLRSTAHRLLGRDPDIWHIHNHALGKNGFVPQLVWHLANAGCHLLLQLHDFAEDGRPENYRLLREHLGDKLDAILYPAARHIGYAPINFRDKAFLEGMGLTNVQELPNAVTALPLPEHSENTLSPKTMVYPARAIRRKNLGEFLLWSLLAPEGYRFVSTLAPDNPKAQPIYNDWVAFAKELNLPIDFDVGRTTDFATLVQNAEALISTSMAEGFGLAFLEPWLEGKMLVGRNLPEITTDFATEGLDLSTLYTTLPIPLEWIGETAFFKTLETAMQSTYSAYSKDWNPADLARAKAAFVIDGKVDFGILDEPFQRTVIRHLVENPADQALIPSLSLTPAPDMLVRNRKVVTERYSLKAYGDRLFGIYRQLAATSSGKVTAAHAAKLLDKFLQPERVHFLKAS